MCTDPICPVPIFPLDIALFAISCSKIPPLDIPIVRGTEPLYVVPVFKDNPLATVNVLTERVPETVASIVAIPFPSNVTVTFDPASKPLTTEPLEKLIPFTEPAPR